jgi:legumain
VRLEQTVEGTAARALAESTLAEFTAARQLVDQRVAATLRALANRHGGGTAAAERWATATRTRGQPLVDDWMCLQESIGAWEAACGALGQYGMRHTRAFANLCNDGLGAAAVTELAASACSLAHLANPVAAAATATL